MVLVSSISPYRDDRQEARRTIGNFIEVYVSAPVEVCEGRDPKGLYRMVREGKIKGFTGIDDPYEPPLNSEVVCETHFETPQQSARKVTSFVVKYLACQDCA